jgi:RND family efflux transporter MFP subunit
VAAGGTIQPVDGGAEGIILDARRRQLIGVRTVRVAPGALPRHIRGSGIIRYDEARITDFNLKFQGWIRELSVSYVGQRVHTGQPLFTVYSPELDALQNNLIGALRAREQTAATQTADSPQYGDRLVESPRLRLKQWDVAEEEVRRLEQTRQLPDGVVFRSPRDGVVIDKAVLTGMRFEPGQTLYKIADASTLIVEADFSEPGIESLHVGASATIRIDASPGQERLSGRVVSLYPFLSEQTRTLKARIELPNRSGRVKPGMFATVEVAGHATTGLVIPEDAVIDSGTRQTVFVAEGEGYYQPRAVKIGQRSDGRVLVLEGLRDGEEVATRAAFFLDSESQMRSAFQNYGGAAVSLVERSEPSTGAKFIVRVSPDPPRTGHNSFDVSVRDANGRPLNGATVLVRLSMPSMPSMNMPAMHAEANLIESDAGNYTGHTAISMAGRWNVTVTARRSGHLIGTTQTTLLVR